MRGGNILFVDDCFSMHPKRAIKILDALHKCYGEEMKYFIEARISNILSGEFLEGFQMQITLKRNASSATAERLFHF